MTKNREKARPGAEGSCSSSISLDRAIAEIAARQLGRVSRAQLVAIGASDDAIADRVRAGRLNRLRKGVYALGLGAEGSRERCATALLDVGPGSLVSHLSAAAEHRIRLPAPFVVDVTSPRRLPRRDGVRVHTRVIDPAEVRRLDGLPLTSPSQTLFDLATMLGLRALAKAANEAFVLGLVTIGDLHRTLERNRRRRGIAAFRRLIAMSTPRDAGFAPSSRRSSTRSCEPAASLPGGRTSGCGSAPTRSSPTCSGGPSG